ncbi:hypothetical protein [Gottfriedia acidiceleris]|uniref:hypothetical protein n=1 Tax=Gottfriedia acidiceleris TaxID=371036 RepID=UPI000B442308|nr:hypothetical protein [Gottfriedia acidiceleris]
MKTVIQAKNLSKNYGKTTVLKNVDLTIQLGEFTALQFYVLTEPHTAISVMFPRQFYVFFHHLLQS